MARDAGAITIDMHDEYVYDRLLDLTGGIGPDVCIDAVGMEAHGYNDRRARLRQGEDEPVHGDRAAGRRSGRRFICCRKGGTVSIPGVYGGFADKIPLGALMNKGPHDQDRPDPRAPVRAEAARLRPQGRIDPSFVVTHRLPLSEAPHAYDIFREKQDGCIKVVLDPAA